MTIGDFLIIAFIVFLFYWLIKRIYILATRIFLLADAVIESIVTKIKNIQKKKNKKEKEKVLEELLRNKIGKDCVSVVRSYLHENDLEFIKAAFYPYYKPDIKFSIFRSDNNNFYYLRQLFKNTKEYEILENLRWYRAGVRYKDYESIESMINSLVKKNYTKCIMYILQHFPIDTKKLMDAVIVNNKINLLKLIEKSSHLATRITYGPALAASSNTMMDYLHFTLRIPLPKDIYEKAMYENTYNGKNLIKKLNWIYSVVGTPTYHVFHYVCKQIEKHNTEKIITWLIDHNCPTTALRA